MAQIKNNNIVRLRVDIRDKHQNVRTHSYIDVAHSVLGIVSRNHQQGLGKILKQNAELLQIEDNDCRPGQNMGEMAVQGYRSYAKSIEMYKTTTGLFSKLEKSAGTFLSTYGFIKWVNNLRKNLVNNNGNRKSLGGTQDTSPWVTMSVSTVDYCNEDHLDGLDACQGITIWHESNPPRRNQPPNHNLTNWYFCFPNMEIFIAGSWVKGVAVPLRHGTVITWDARLIRHCTAFPEFRRKKVQGEEINASRAYGTYLGIDQRVKKRLRSKKEEGEV